MKGKHRAASAQRFPRVAIFAFVICAVFVATFRSVDVPAHAQTEDGIVYEFSNLASITIPDGGPANPYPSTINVANIPSQLAKVTVKLNNLSHPFPSDIDVLLVGPQGQTAIIMSDAGGFTPASGITLTIDDAAPTLIPNPLTSGTYQPTNLQLGDTFPAPAPTPSANSALSIFNGTNPNGAWSLYVVDDVAIDGGTIQGGWSLTITPAISGQNTNPITIPDSGIASPYPSDIVVANNFNPISRVSVTLTNFSHSSPDDVDIMLVSPSGRAVVLMSDVGGNNAVSNLNILLDDFAPSALPDSGALTSGTFRPTDYEPGDTFPGPAPSGIPIAHTLASLNGSVANGTWKLFVVDDSGNNVGNISGGWNILLGTGPDVISIAGAGTANPYPSEISVSGLPGSITHATVEIETFSHLSPDDVDIMLVGPDGRRIVLMSDAGGTTEAGGVNLIFDDNAAAQIPDSGPLTTGTYRPSDYEPGETFPAPAPSPPPVGTTLGSFYGGTPNGIWRLYVVNENGTSYGSIAGSWSVTLQTSTSACLVNISPTVAAFPVGGGSGGFNVTQPTGCTWTAHTSDSFIDITSGSSGAGNGSVAFTVAANQGPARTGTIDVTNGVATRSFLVQQPSGCPLSVSQTTVNFAATGGTGNVSVTASGGCTWQGSTTAPWIQITPVPTTGNGPIIFTVLPNATHVARSATINVGSLTITVNQAPTRTVAFDFDGDSRTDVSVFRPSSGTWWITRSSGGVTATDFGIGSDKLAPADYDGDRKSDIAVYRDGTWYILRSSDGAIAISSWGTTGDVPVPADYNSDGSAELAVFRPSTGTWWILNANSTYSSTAFGIDGDIPTPGDYDGDGKTDLSVYRGSTSTWWVLNSSNGMVNSTAFGVAGDIPVAADYDGDGRDNIALFRPSTGTWYRSTNAATNYDAVQWGISSDRPAPGDYDGDGKSEPAVFRSGVWYILGSASGVQILQFGSAGDRAVPGAFIP